MDKKGLSERDTCTKFITPALRNAGWGLAAVVPTAGRTPSGGATC